MTTVLPGRRVAVEVPASSANLGPGFDALGLALDLYNSCTVEVVEGPTQVQVEGEGAADLPTGEQNLIVRSLRRGLDRLGAEVEGVRIRSTNRIPGSRGLGSSSAAIVAGLAAAHGLVRGAEPFDPADWLPLADEIEGHPDNVAAALFGDLVIAYRSVSTGRVAASYTRVDPQIRALALIPSTALGTEAARSVLPSTVPYRDAAATAGRAALLVQALTNEPGALFEATADWLHQPYRASIMVESAQLLDGLRDKGLAAVISGAGPTVLVLGRAEEIEIARALAPSGWVARTMSVAAGARVHLQTASDAGR